MPGNVGEACLEARVLDVCRDLGEDIRLVAAQVAWNDTSPVTDHVMWAVGFRSVLGLEMHEGDGREKAVDAKRGLVMGDGSGAHTSVHDLCMASGSPKADAVVPPPIPKIRPANTPANQILAAHPAAALTSKRTSGPLRWPRILFRISSIQLTPRNTKAFNQTFEPLVILQLRRG